MKHLGRNIFHIRNAIGMTQNTLALRLNISQQAISKYEQSENIEEDALIRIANAMGVTPDFIQNFIEATSNSHNNPPSYMLDKIMNVFEETLKTYTDLYERIIKEKDQMIDLLRRSEKKI